MNLYKVLFINCSENGSTGNIISSIADELISRGNTPVLCVPEVKESRPYKKYPVCLPFETGIYRRVACLTGLPYGFAPLSTSKIKRIILSEKPDIIHMHCPNGYMLNLYDLITWIKKNEISLVLTNHCEMFYTANCPHSYDCEKWKNGCGNCPDYNTKTFRTDKTQASWKKMYNAFTGFKNAAVVSVSGWVYKRSKESALLGRFDNYLVENGVDTDTFIYMPDRYEQLRIQYHILPGKKIVIFVTALFSSSKGSSFYLELANKCGSDILFLLVGSQGNEEGLPSNVINIGRVKNKDDLAALYGISDCTLVLSKKETFSMVTAESQCCGTPVVGFLAGGPESIALSDYSEFCEYGNIEILKAILNDMLLRNMTSNDKKVLSDKACAKFRKQKMVDSYLDIYESMLPERRNHIEKQL